MFGAFPGCWQLLPCVILRSCILIYMICTYNHIYMYMCVFLCIIYIYVCIHLFIYLLKVNKENACLVSILNAPVWEFHWYLTGIFHKQNLFDNVRTATLGLASTALMAASNACIALVGGNLMVSCEQRGVWRYWSIGHTHRYRSSGRL